MEQQEYIKALFEKYLNGECTAQEIRLLFAHFELLDDEVMLRQLVQSAVHDDHHIEPLVHDKLDALTGRVEAKLTEAVQQQRRSFAARLFSKPALAVAAVLLVLLSIGTLLYQQKAGTEIVIAGEEDILPGGHLATLTLADGSVIQLSTDQNGIVVGDGITYLDGSLVIGERPETGDGNPNRDFLTLTTPKGGTYQLTLSDGTKVWLNAASTLRYPARFVGEERVVELEGEAYFEVSHQRSAVSYQPGDRTKPKAKSQLPVAKKIPFRVASRGQTVEVLGTQFNIAAYSDEEEILTTLVEGSVRVIPVGRGQSTEQNQRHVTLSPGEQSVVKGGQTVINPVDVSTFTAWKNGLFSFKETEMRNAMNQLARWYNVDIVYEGQIPETFFFGDIRRDKSLTQVLTILKKSGVNFKIGKNGDRNMLIVLP